MKWFALCQQSVEVPQKMIQIFSGNTQTSLSQSNLGKKPNTNKAI